MVVLNDVLCFVSNKFGKVVVKTLKSILSDFYSGEVLSSAKLQLLKWSGHVWCMTVVYCRVLLSSFWHAFTRFSQLSFAVSC